MSVLTVVGKAESRSDFEQELSGLIADSFTINFIVPLAIEDEERRFLAYVISNEEDLDPAIAEAMVEWHTDVGFETNVHDDAETAGEFAQEHYGSEAYSTFTDPISSADMFRRDVFFGLIQTGEVTMFRARLDGNPCIALCHFTVGNRPNDAVATPLAILFDDSLAGRLELPVKSSYDRQED